MVVTQHQIGREDGEYREVKNYGRVSTEEQNLDRQQTSTFQYATERLGVPLDNVEWYSDKSTGTNTDRRGYRELIEDVEAGEGDAVIVQEISRMARSLQDLERTVERITEAGAEVHFVRDGLVFGTDKDSPMTRLQMQMLGAFAEWQARVKQMNTREGLAARRDSDEEYHHGPAPIGFYKEDGHLYQAENYHDVCAILDRVVKGELSKRAAADELDSSRATIRRAVEDRPELYGL